MHGSVWEADLVCVQSQHDSDDFSIDLNRSKWIHFCLSLPLSLCCNTHSCKFITLSLISLSHSWVLLLLGLHWQRIWSISGPWIQINCACVNGSWRNVEDFWEDGVLGELFTRTHTHNQQFILKGWRCETLADCLNTPKLIWVISLNSRQESREHSGLFNNALSLFVFVSPSPQTKDKVMKKSNTTYCLLSPRRLFYALSVLIDKLHFIIHSLDARPRQLVVYQVIT